MLESAVPVLVGGPYFEELEVGQRFEAPALTLTTGHAALHQALVGDRLRLPLDAALSQAVTGSELPLAHPSLVSDVSIGQSTVPTQRVVGNLFYRGLVLQRPVFVGDTLRTSSEVVALKQNRPRADGSATGLVALRVRTENQRRETVLDYWRCPMIPLKDASVATGHSDALDAIPEEIDDAALEAVVPDWNYGYFRGKLPGEHFADLAPGTVWEIEGRDTVTAAPELARLTLNVAMTHTDAGASSHGRRLVYGGHTISVAAAQATRALPNLVTIVAWRGCDHTGPVFEGDVLATELTLLDKREGPGKEAGLLDLRALVRAERSTGEVEKVLDWRFVAVAA